MSYKNDIRYEVGPVIKAYLGSKGIRQKHVAAKVGMTLAAFNSRMNGFTEITATELYAICAELGVSADAFNILNAVKSA